MQSTDARTFRDTYKVSIKIEMALATITSRFAEVALDI